MVSSKKYRFSNSIGMYIVFDSNGYVIETKGWGHRVWCVNPDTFDSELIGKHVEEVAELIKEHAVRYEDYINFEIQVHLELLKAILKENQ